MTTTQTIYERYNKTCGVHQSAKAQYAQRSSTMLHCFVAETANHLLPIQHSCVTAGFLTCGLRPRRQRSSKQAVYEQTHAKRHKHCGIEICSSAVVLPTATHTHTRLQFEAEHPQHPVARAICTLVEVYAAASMLGRFVVRRC